MKRRKPVYRPPLLSWSNARKFMRALAAGPLPLTINGWVVLPEDEGRFAAVLESRR